MTNTSDDDKLEGDFGRRRARVPRERASFPDVSVSGSNKRARAAWFNRTTGAGAVKLAAERPAGSQRVIVKARVVVHATAAAKGGSAGGMMRHTLYVERDGMPDVLQVTASTEDGIAMAIEHKTLPVGGVQFHPESLMSLGGEVGLRIVENAFRLKAN